MDQFAQPKPAVLREILDDKRNGGSSRTERAILDGALRFTSCEACGGQGRFD